MRATTLAKFAKFWMAALVLAVALAASGAAFAQESDGGDDGNVAAAARARRAAPGPAAPGSNGPAFGPDAASSGACDVGPTLPTPPMFGEAGDAVKALSRATESYIRNCGCATQACIADALDKYAEALAQVDAAPAAAIAGRGERRRPGGAAGARRAHQGRGAPRAA